MSHRQLQIRMLGFGMAEAAKAGKVRDRTMVLQNIWRRYDTAIWVRFIGQVVSALGNFMITPFISLYLYERLHVSLMHTMLVVSIAPAVSLAVSVPAGRLTDRLGRRSLMCTSLFGGALALALYALAQSALQFALITVLAGVFDSLYWPAANAQITDVVPEEQRTEVFSLLHMGLNIGAAVGPLAGAMLFTTAPRLLFSVATAATLLTALLIARFVPETRTDALDAAGAEKTHPRRPAVDEETHPGSPAAGEPGSEHFRPPGNSRRRFHIRDYLLIVWITLLSLPITLLYAQVTTNLPLHLSHHFVNYAHVFASMISFNGACVILFQMLISRLTRKVPSWILLTISFTAFACVGFGYAWAPSLPVLLATEFIFTLGEMIGFPQLQHVVGLLAPPDKRGVYFSIFGLRWSIGGVAGPIVGGWLMRTMGGTWMFSIIGSLVFAAGWLMAATLLWQRPQAALPPGVDITT